MKSVDTNVLARFFVDDPDDPEAVRQRPSALQALSGSVFVAVTVVLEFEWVLRGFYQLPRKEVTRVLRALASLANVTLEDRQGVATALDLHESGLDLADALHLVRSRRVEAFLTFDRALGRRAAKSGAGLAVQVLK